ncbi:MAG: bifunctional adenosylcobinamide kinase/adenosylcobinamide-phosphate guanylyltransferase [Polyangiales bacterium]
MTRGLFIVVGGGVRSGKSAFAVRRALSLGTRRTFLATAEPFDDDMRARARAHREERGDDFATVEAPRALCEALAEAARSADVVLVDCLTLWLSNLLLAERTQAEIAAEVARLADVVAASPAHVVLVTNEVGMGVVPDSSLGRAFRDVAGRAHQALAARADELYFAMMGQLLRLRPDPIALVPAHAG